MDDDINDLGHWYVRSVAVHRRHDGLLCRYGGLAEQAGEQRRLQRREFPFQRDARLDGPLRFLQRVVFEFKAISLIFKLGYFCSKLGNEFISWGGQRFLLLFVAEECRSGTKQLRPRRRKERGTPALESSRVPGSFRRSARSPPRRQGSSRSNCGPSS